jgi:hypothetical protein
MRPEELTDELWRPATPRSTFGIVFEYDMRPELGNRLFSTPKHSPFEPLDVNLDKIYAFYSCSGNNRV